MGFRQQLPEASLQTAIRQGLARPSSFLQAHSSSLVPSLEPVVSSSRRRLSKPLLLSKRECCLLCADMSPYGMRKRIAAARGRGISRGVRHLAAAEGPSSLYRLCILPRQLKGLCLHRASPATFILLVCHLVQLWYSYQGDKGYKEGKKRLTGVPPNLLIVSSSASLEVYPRRTFVSVNSPSEESEA